MDFVAVMLFTHQGFFYNVYFSFNSFWYQRLILFQIKSQPAYKSVFFTEKKHAILFFSLLTFLLDRFLGDIFEERGVGHVVDGGCL